MVRVDRLSTPDRWLRTRLVASPLHTCPSPPSRGNFCTASEMLRTGWNCEFRATCRARLAGRGIRLVCRENRRFVDGPAGRTPVVRRAKSGRRRTFRAAVTRLPIHRLPAAGGEDPRVRPASGRADCRRQIDGLTLEGVMPARSISDRQGRGYPSSTPGTFRCCSRDA